MDAATTLGVGLILGVRHAADPDHVAAVGAMAESARGPRDAMKTGALWGLGHSITVLAAGVAFVALGVELPAVVVRVAEGVVAALLIALGLVALRGSADRARPRRVGRRALLVGLAHGLAGSAASTLIAVGVIEEPAVALTSLALFCAGTVAGMVAISGVLSLPLRAAGRSEALKRALARGAGLVSVVVGAVLAVELLR